MGPIAYVITSLINISETANNYEDTWASLTLNGFYNEEVLIAVKAIYDMSEPLKVKGLIKFFIDSEEINPEDFSMYRGKKGFNKWELKLNKHGLLEKTKNEGRFFNFFLTPEACNGWFSNIDPLDEQSPVFMYQPLCIYVNKLTEVVGNTNLSFIPIGADVASIPQQNLFLPNIEKLRETIHFISNKNIYLNPRIFTTNQALNSNHLTESFIRHASVILACCTINEFYNEGKVIVDGIRRVSLKLFSNTDITNFNFYKSLTELVVWIYEDRATTRRKLFNDRLTLDIDEQESLLKNLLVYGDIALEQAKGRYSFVITERKDAYVKELKDLLKDLRTQSDLYSQKIRTLLSNFLRDVLASIVLVGFTIFTKFSDNLNLDKHKLLTYVFWTLGFYYLVSILMQVIVDVIDIQVTSKELKYWKKVSSELLPEKEFNQHYEMSLKGRRKSLRWIYPIIAALYIGISISCFVYPQIFENMLNSNDIGTAKKRSTIVEKKPKKTERAIN